MTSNYSGIINRYSQITKLPITERYQKEFLTPNGSVSRYSIIIGDLQATGYAPTTTKKKDLRHIACQAFVDTHDIKSQVPPSYKEIFEAKPGIDYLTYSRDTILKDVHVHINDTAFFEQKHAMLAFDSEGANPPVLAQFCSDPTHVYLFWLPDYFEQVTSILKDPYITKIVCDGAAEEKFFKFPLLNTIDIQGPERKSLITCIKDKFNVELKKNKHIHMQGWHVPFTQDQIDYAAADAIWTLKINNYL